MPKIRVTRTPNGVAPVALQEEWLRRTLPYESVVDLVNGNVRFLVPRKKALDILAAASPQAAAWWRAHDYPESNASYFYFDSQDVVVVEE